MSLAAVRDHVIQARADKGDKAAHAELVKHGLASSAQQHAEAAKVRARVRPEPRY